MPCITVPNTGGNGTTSTTSGGTNIAPRQITVCGSGDANQHGDSGASGGSGSGIVLSPNPAGGKSSTGSSGHDTGADQPTKHHRGANSANSASGRSSGKAGQVSSEASSGGAVGAVAGDVGGVVSDTEGRVSGAASGILTGTPKQTILHTTGYSFQDNQGGDNATISCGVIHKTAGGDGTYDDPITVAVPGHAGQGTETPCGTRIYVPAYRKYFIVEDTGATKYSDAAHIDIYVGGEGTSAGASKKCMDPVTTSDGQPVDATINPEPGLAVAPGPITDNGSCNVGRAGTAP